ncbi:MAG: IS21 family transposase [Niameybacter sp.]
MKGWAMFVEIYNYKVLGLNKSQVAKKLAIDYKTVCKYWDMNPSTFQEIQASAKSRSKKVDAYQHQILEWLKEFPDLSSAQIYDWLLERYTHLEFKERTLRLYVQQLRHVYKLPKNPPLRQYQEIPESPPGEQAQADFGQIWVKKVDGSNVKVYCFALVLAYSRYKFIWWQDRPFNTNDLIGLHERAFEYFGGMPKEIVYDQDRIIVVSENAGDIICTEAFQNYMSHMKFKMRLCRAYDPESKGKVEAVVKFAKYNFARHRLFTDIESFNDECLLWLDRTGNGKIHDITKKVPKEVFPVEKEHLLQIPSSLFNKKSTISLTYSVRKNNTISYKQNRYQVPKGTYSPGKEVLLSLKDDMLVLVDPDTGEVLATHKICTDKGKLIQIHHPEREKGKNLQDLEDKALKLLGDSANAKRFLQSIEEAKPRYYKDQLHLINQVCLGQSIQCIQEALQYCLTKNLISASLFREALAYILSKKAEPSPADTTPIKNQLKSTTLLHYIKPEVRNIEDYLFSPRKDETKWIH